MFRRFVKESSIYATAAILSRGVSFFLLPIYTRVLSAIEFGMTDILTLVSRLIYLTIALEIGQGFFRLYPDAPSESDKKAYASTALWFTLIVYTCFVGASLIFSRSLAELILDTSDHVILIQLTLLTIWFYGPYKLILSLFRSRLEAKNFARVSLATTLMTIGSSLIFVLILDMGVIGVVCGGLIGQMAGTLYAYLLSRQNFLWIIERGKLGEMLKFSLPLVPSSIGVYVALYIDRIAIKELMSFRDLGLFGRGYQVASPVYLIMGAFAGSLMSLIYNHYREPETPGEIARIFRYFTVMVLMIFAGLSLFSKEILIILTTPEYLGAAEVIPFLVLSIIFNGLYIFMPGLVIKKKTGIIAVINIFQAIAGVALNILLIPVMGIMGSALATMVIAITAFLINMYFSQRNYYVPHGWRQLGLAFLIVGIAVIVGMQVPAMSWEGLFSKLGLLCVIVAAFFWLRLVEMTDIQRLWVLLANRFIKKQK